MLRIRIVAAAAIGAIALVLIASMAGAQTPNTAQSGGLPALSAGLLPPHETKTAVHAKTAHRINKKFAASKSAMKKRSARSKHLRIAVTPALQPPQPDEAAPPADVLPVADTTPLADIDPPQTAPADDVPAPSEIVVGGQTVQIASPGQANAIDLAADEARDAPAPVTEGDPAGAAPASPTVLAAHADLSASRGAWIAQVLAALGGAVTAAAVAWFLISSGPVRTYG